MTEAASQITANPVDGNRRGSVGLPVGVELRVVGRGAGPDRRADRAVRYGAPASPPPTGPRPDRPARAGGVPATGPDGWLATGDLGHVDGDGYLYLTGRADDVINRAGEKIQPREIEEVILGDPRVAWPSSSAAPTPPSARNRSPTSSRRPAPVTTTAGAGLARPAPPP